MTIMIMTPQHGLVMGIVMTLTTTWSAVMIMEIAVDLMSIHSIVQNACALKDQQQLL